MLGEDPPGIGLIGSRCQGQARYGKKAGYDWKLHEIRWIAFRPKNEVDKSNTHLG
jgi:hypothetical protein